MCKERKCLIRRAGSDGLRGCFRSASHMRSNIIDYYRRVVHYSRTQIIPRMPYSKCCFAKAQTSEAHSHMLQVIIFTARMTSGPWQNYGRPAAAIDSRSRPWSSGSLVNMIGGNETVPKSPLSSSTSKEVLVYPSHLCETQEVTAREHSSRHQAYRGLERVSL